MPSKIEEELRFALSTSEFSELRARLRELNPPFVPGVCAHELTVMYDNPNPTLSFYTPSVDGRLRLRSMTSAEPVVLSERHVVAQATGLLTWKRRVPELDTDEVRREEEVEIALAGEALASVEFLLTDVLRCPRISAYERTRETLYIGGVEVALDLFPYGRIVELELKSGDVSSLHSVAETLGLNASQISLLSCDDTYRVLLAEVDGTERTDIMFDDETMPQLDNLIASQRRKLLRR